MWGKIVVLGGELEYRTQGAQPRELVLAPDQPGTVVPEMLHAVEPRVPVRFYVEFYRQPRKITRPGTADEDYRG